MLEACRRVLVYQWQIHEWMNEWMQSVLFYVPVHRNSFILLTCIFIFMLENLQRLCRKLRLLKTVPFQSIADSSECAVLKLGVKCNPFYTSSLWSAAPWCQPSESPVFALGNTSYLLVGIIKMDSCGVNRCHSFYCAPFSMCNWAAL